MRLAPSTRGLIGGAATDVTLAAAMVWLFRHGMLGYALDCLVLIVLFGFYTVRDYLYELNQEARKKRKAARREARRSKH